MPKKNSKPNLSATGVCKECQELLTFTATPEHIAAGATEDDVLDAFANDVLKHLLKHSLVTTAEGQPIMDPNGQPQVIPDGPHAILGELMQLISVVFAIRHVGTIDPRLAKREAETVEILRDWLDSQQSTILNPAGKSMSVGGRPCT
jgi:hypothetical protein